MKLLIDMNLSPLWVPFMAGKGVEAVHWSTVGQAGATDSEILDFAATRGWIVSRTTWISAHCWRLCGPTNPASFRSGPRTSCQRPSAILWPPPFGLLKHTSNQAPSSLVDSFRHRIRLLPI